MIHQDFVILTSLLPKIGRKTAFKILNKLNFKISNNEDLFSFIEEQNKSSFNKEDKIKAENKLEQIKIGNEKNDIKIVSYFDNDYPDKLKKASDPPLFLNYKGNKKLLNHTQSVAIVGTREPLDIAFELGKRASSFFAKNNFNVVSGLAIGCDTSAHIGAIEVKGKTTAILAHGLQTIYPKQNKNLSQEILDNDGLILSEYVVGTSPFANFFVERDRIQSYLSDFLIVVQTDIKGGTMHAVNTTIKDNKEVCVIYPQMNKFLEHPKSRGNSFLIAEKNAFVIRTEIDLDFLNRKYSANIISIKEDEVNEIVNGENLAAILEDKDKKIIIDKVESTKTNNAKGIQLKIPL